MIRGEYWIQGSHVEYCDGDVGDVNHAGTAISYAQSELFNEVGVDHDDDCDPDRVYDLVAEALAEEHDIDPRSEEVTDDPGNFVLKHLPEKFHRLLNVAANRYQSNPIEYALENWGWHRVHQCHVETLRMTPEALEEIVAGLEEILFQEGEEEPDPETLVWIWSADGRRNVNFTWQELTSGDYKERLVSICDPEQAIKNALDRLDSADREMMHPVYAGVSGG